MLPSHRCFSAGGDDDDRERSVSRYNEQRLKLEAVQAASIGWWQRQRNKIYLAYILQANDEFDIEEFTEGAGLVFDALNTAMYSGEPITEDTFNGMVRTYLQLHHEKNDARKLPAVRRRKLGISDNMMR